MIFLLNRRSTKAVGQFKSKVTYGNMYSNEAVTLLQFLPDASPPQGYSLTNSNSDH